MYNFHLFYHGHFVHKPIGQCQCIHKTGPLIHLIIQIFFNWSYHLVCIHMRYKYLHIFRPFRNDSPHSYSLNFFANSFPIMFPPSPWLLTALILLLVISPSKRGAQQSVLCRTIPTWRISIHHSFRDVPERDYSDAAVHFHVVCLLLAEQTPWAIPSNAKISA